jgi:hypothetical protein
MRALRWIAVGVLVVLVGASVGFLISLLRPRRYADIPGTGDHEGALGRG